MHFGGTDLTGPPSPAYVMQCALFPVAFLSSPENNKAADEIISDHDQDLCLELGNQFILMNDIIQHIHSADLDDHSGQSCSDETPAFCRELSQAAAMRPKYDQLVGHIGKQDGHRNRNNVADIDFQMDHTAQDRKYHQVDQRCAAPDEKITHSLRGQKGDNTVFRCSVISAAVSIFICVIGGFQHT